VCISCCSLAGASRQVAHVKIPSIACRETYNCVQRDLLLAGAGTDERRTITVAGEGAAAKTDSPGLGRRSLWGRGQQHQGTEESQGQGAAAWHVPPPCPDAPCSLSKQKRQAYQQELTATQRPGKSKPTACSPAATLLGLLFQLPAQKCSRSKLRCACTHIHIPDALVELSILQDADQHNVNSAKFRLLNSLVAARVRLVVVLPRLPNGCWTGVVGQVEMPQARSDSLKNAGFFFLRQPCGMNAAEE